MRASTSSRPSAPHLPPLPAGVQGCAGEASVAVQGALGARLRGVLGKLGEPAKRSRSSDAAAARRGARRPRSSCEARRRRRRRGVASFARAEERAGDEAGSASRVLGLRVQLYAASGTSLSWRRRCLGPGGDTGRRCPLISRRGDPRRRERPAPDELAAILDGMRPFSRAASPRRADAWRGARRVSPGRKISAAVASPEGRRHGHGRARRPVGSCGGRQHGTPGNLRFAARPVGSSACASLPSGRVAARRAAVAAARPTRTSDVVFIAPCARAALVGCAPTARTDKLARNRAACRRASSPEQREAGANWHASCRHQRTCKSCVRRLRGFAWLMPAAELRRSCRTFN